MDKGFCQSTSMGKGFCQRTTCMDKGFCQSTCMKKVFAKAHVWIKVFAKEQHVWTKVFAELRSTSFQLLLVRNTITEKLPNVFTQRFKLMNVCIQFKVSQ